LSSAAIRSHIPIPGIARPETINPDQSMTTQSIAILPLLFVLALCVFLIVALWKVFAKAGQPGWAAIIPIYNCYVLIKVAGKPGWWLIFYFIPLVNVVIAVMVTLAVARAFGKGVGFGLGLIFLGFIFYPILGFGSATYQPQPAVPAAPPPPAA
jgi:hypothetical protein